MEAERNHVVDWRAESVPGESALRGPRSWSIFLPRADACNKFIDRAADVCGFYASQLKPFGDPLSHELGKFV